MNYFADPLAHPVVAIIEEPLQLFSTQRPVTRASLALRTMHGHVPFMANLHRVSTEPLLAHLIPPVVPAVGQIPAEQLHGLLISSCCGATGL